MVDRLRLISRGKELYTERAVYKKRAMSICFGLTVCNVQSSRLRGQAELS